MDRSATSAKRDLGDNRGKPAMPQTLLKTGKHSLFVPRFDIDHAIGDEPGLGEGRGEEVLPNDAPQRPAAGPSGDSRRKERRGRAVDRALAAAGHLMQSAERQSASRQMPVDRLDAEGQHQSPACGRAFEAPDALAKLLDNRKAGGRPHVLCNSLGRVVCSLFVSITPRESTGV